MISKRKILLGFTILAQIMTTYSAQASESKTSSPAKASTATASGPLKSSQINQVASQILKGLKKDEIHEQEAEFQKFVYFTALEEVFASSSKSGKSLYEYVSSAQAQKQFLGDLKTETTKVSSMTEVEAFIALAKAEAKHSIFFNNLEPEQKEVNDFIDKVSKKIGLE